MKGQSKRFVDHRGNLFPMFGRKRQRDLVDKNDKVGFLDLWRYATPLEVSLSVLGVLCAWTSSVGVAAAVIVYGQITSLFVSRTRMEEPAASSSSLIQLFGGAHSVPAEGANNSTYHMEALVSDSVAFAWASAAIMAVQLLSACCAVLCLNYAGGRMVNRVRAQLLTAVLRQEVAFFDTNTSLNLAAMLTEDIDKFRLGVSEHVSMCAYLCGATCATSGAALAAGWRLALSGLAVVPIAVLVAGLTAEYQSRWSRTELSLSGAATSGAQEALAALRTVRAYAGEAEEIRRYGSALSSVEAAGNRRGLAAGAGAGAGWFLTYCLNAIVLAYGCRLCVWDMDLPVHERQYNPGVMVTILFCTFMAAQNVAMCHPHLELFSTARGAASAIYTLLERTPLIDNLSEQGETPEILKGHIVFEDVYFNYPSRPDVKVLRGFNLEIRPGETVALVGPSGCGKSTALQLIARLYDADKGTVRVDDYRVSQLRPHHYRSRVGFVGQEPVLFSGTIRDNIALGVPEATQEDIEQAAILANAHQFVIKLAKGYETEIGERGAQLSGGQKQRIAIARAVLRKPNILLLDEPTSALDPTAEKLVQAALDAASAGRTTVVVSHRLSTIVNASRIVYIEQGAVLEQGTYQELLDKRGLFWNLLQADMTSKAASKTVAPSTTHDDVVEADEEADQFPPGFTRQDTMRESTTPERVLRGSRRFSSLSRIAVAGSPAHLQHTTPDGDTSPVPSVSTWQLLKLNRPEWPLLLGGGIASAIIGATMPLFALLFSKLYGMFTWSDTSAILYWSGVYAGLFAAAAAATGLVTAAQGALLATAGNRLTTRLRRKLFTCYLNQEQAWFDRPENSIGALCARLSADCSAVQGATGSRLGTMLQGICTMTIGVTLAMAYSWKMTLVSLLAVPVVIGAIYLEGLVMRRSESKERASLESASKIATEAVLALRTVHTLSIEWTLIVRYRAALASGGAGTLSTRLLRGAVYGLCLCAPTLGYALSLAYGGYLVAREALPLHYTILVSEALIYGAWMLAEALSFAPNFSAARRSGARVVTMLKREPKVKDVPMTDEYENWTSNGDVALDKVTIRFGVAPPSLNSASLVAPACRRVALVGGSGAGKSTVLAALTRVYDVSDGRLTLDGRDIRLIPLSTLRRQFALVQQEPALFARSIRENIAYGDNYREVSTDEIVAAAQQANVHNFVSGLPSGYDSILGPGTQLSGGQKQRIAIARALVRKPRVMLLDEPTSALDAHSEQLVQSALDEACRGRTTILVAHRLATVTNYDIIYVLDRGSVIESGTHEELLSLGGAYHQLWSQQAAATS